MSSDMSIPSSPPQSPPHHPSGLLHSYPVMNPYGGDYSHGFTSSYGLQQPQTVAPGTINAPMMYSHMIPHHHQRQGSAQFSVNMNPWTPNTHMPMEDDEPGGEMHQDSDSYQSQRSSSSSKRHWGTGRKKIEIKFIEKKLKRQITFSKRKAGMMKKIHELTTLTGTQALLVLVSETGHVYTYATPKLDRLVKDPEKNIIKQTLDEYDMNEREKSTSQNPGQC